MFQAAASVFFVLASAASVKHQSSCSSPSVRQEWRSLSSEEKSSYIGAVKCLKTVPSRLSNSSSDSLWDDFGHVHRQLDTSIHLVAVFLPWHRWYVQLYENALREDCGYNGTTVCWNWSLDYEDPASSPVFDVETGFGGDGDNNTGCVTDGPFAGYNVSTPDDHCLQRAFNMSAVTEWAAPGLVNDTLAVQGYSSFRTTLEDGPHRSAHAGVGGDMLVNYSPNDPIFFLHHCNIDRLWWQWQMADIDVRQSEYGGNRYQNDTATNATLNDAVPMVSDFVGESLIVSDIMWTQSGLFCYTYED
ncbi:hypothetical protein DL768_011472 [Monosporascus sp. mg162]|nr:hypothetical protein DL768_011472 [Monosporascus sp. mg162]